MEAGLPYVPLAGYLPFISRSGFVRKMLRNLTIVESVLCMAGLGRFLEEEIATL